MSNLSFDRFLAEEKLYFIRDGHFSPTLQKVLSLIETEAACEAEHTILETNETEFTVHHAQKIICVRFIYGDPAIVKILQVGFHAFIQTIERLKMADS